MSTILETLQNAEYNLQNISKMGLIHMPVVKEQFHNAVTLLEKGYDLYDDIESLLKGYNIVDDVPDSEDD